MFADGARRVFKAADVKRFIEPAPKPDEAVSEQLERGLASGGVATPKALHLDFVAQIRANRRDAGAYLAYADWLQSQKDPRGELIVIQHRLEKAKRDQKLHAAQRKLFERHTTYFVPRELAEIIDDNPGCSVTWRYGFLASVRLVRRGDRGSDPAMVIPELLAHPSAEFLESLAFGAVGDEYIRVIAAIAHTKHALLEELVVDPGNAKPLIGDIAPLFRALPSLRRLVLRGRSLRMGSAAKHDTLRSLVVDIDEARKMAPIVRSKLPALEELELDAPGLVLEANDLIAMLDGKRMPRLRRLVLRNTQNATAILDAIASSVHLPKLDELVVTGDITGYTAALEQIKARAKLRVFEVTDAYAHRREPERTDWQTLGRDDDIVWGERDGFSAFVRLGTTHDGCSCGQKTCLHVQSLWRLAAHDYAFPRREVPDDFMGRLRRV